MLKSIKKFQKSCKKKITNNKLCKKRIVHIKLEKNRIKK